MDYMRAERMSVKLMRREDDPDSYHEPYKTLLFEDPEAHVTEVRPLRCVSLRHGASLHHARVAESGGPWELPEWANGQAINSGYQLFGSDE